MQVCMCTFLVWRIILAPEELQVWPAGKLAKQVARQRKKGMRQRHWKWETLDTESQINKSFYKKTAPKEYKINPREYEIDKHQMLMW